MTLFRSTYGFLSPRFFIVTLANKTLQLRVSCTSGWERRVKIKFIFGLLVHLAFKACNDVFVDSGGNSLFSGFLMHSTFFVALQIKRAVL